VLPCPDPSCDGHVQSAVTRNGRKVKQELYGLTKAALRRWRSAQLAAEAEAVVQAERSQRQAAAAAAAAAADTPSSSGGGGGRGDSGASSSGGDGGGASSGGGSAGSCALAQAAALRFVRGGASTPSPSRSGSSASGSRTPPRPGTLEAAVRSGGDPTLLGLRLLRVPALSGAVCPTRHLLLECAALAEPGAAGEQLLARLEAAGGHLTDAQLFPTAAAAAASFADAAGARAAFAAVHGTSLGGAPVWAGFLEGFPTRAALARMATHVAAAARGEPATPCPGGGSPRVPATAARSPFAPGSPLVPVRQLLLGSPRAAAGAAGGSLLGTPPRRAAGGMRLGA